ncbi:MAG TPA: hypothetical protein VNT99_14605 [Methylomirabilota bacterium]|nr:hypothetical protein [Methylomirabilota bacterium]
MKVIQPNCRVQFTAADIDFIVANLGRKSGDGDCVTRLLSDPESRDAILDDETLFHALLEHRGCLGVSSHFYFYILVRNVLRRTGIDDRVVADYIAEILAEYSNIERTHCRVPGQPEPLNYFFEMLLALQRADDRNNFELRAHIGNHALFITGVFPDRIRVRAEKRGFPDLRYFEGIGQSSFRIASDHRLAERYELGPVFDTLAERFGTARKALNDLSERLLSWEDDRYAIPILKSSKILG